MSVSNLAADSSNPSDHPASGLGRVDMSDLDALDVETPEQVMARYAPTGSVRFDRDGKPVAESVAMISMRCADAYLTPDRLPGLRRHDTKTVHDGLLNEINRKIMEQNALIKSGAVAGVAQKPLTRLGFAEVARLILALHTVILLAPSNRNSDPDLNILATYDDDPTSPTYGTYRSSQGHIRSIARRYCPNVTTKEFTEVLTALRDYAPKRSRGDNPDLIACRNGIVDYNGGDPKFMEFSPEYVFLAKLDVDWNPAAENVVIHNDDDGTDWDVESWMSSLDDDPEVVELLWQIVGATVRPYVSWNKAAFFYSTQGNNGKGTLVSLMRNILGPQSYASIPLADFGKDFMLEPLTRASAILVDENDVGTFVDKAANFKAIVTNDVITINRKHKAPIAHQHFGFMVQCLNDQPTIKDKSDSLYRRQLFIPFTKCFTGAERRYIKDDYLKRPEVLEYVLKRVLTMSYYTLSEPDAVRLALEDFKENNDPIRAFWNEVKNELVWDLLPFQFLYDLYKSWLGRNMPNSKPVGRNKFVEGLVALVRTDETSQWECEDRSARLRPGDRMRDAELLIAEYELVDWADPNAPKSKPEQYAIFPVDRQKDSYRGLLRKSQEQLDAIAEAQREERLQATAAALAGHGITVGGVDEHAKPMDAPEGGAS
ncbi:DNA primase family protein [Gordonia paraffinivorans]|uniref:DNA primase family protein n=1 Tax=Gordonia paraffinivorans TaxID=175628 RepID=UPI001E297688|nr:phage/plasmid primase, P4 family [Gordonia paraffinivorans]MCD2143724.1 phage/plasmid primase, P4 family [Gordonia paraffinivorans]